MKRRGFLNLIAGACGLTAAAKLAPARLISHPVYAIQLQKFMPCKRVTPGSYVYMNEEQYARFAEMRRCGHVVYPGQEARDETASTN